MTELRTLAYRLASIADDIFFAGAELTEGGEVILTARDEEDIEDTVNHLTDLISPVNPDTGDPLNQTDHDRASAIIHTLLEDAINFNYKGFPAHLH